jgi:hypothetical protein
MRLTCKEHVFLWCGSVSFIGASITRNDLIHYFFSTEAIRDDPIFYFWISFAIFLGSLYLFIKVMEHKELKNHKSIITHLMHFNFYRIPSWFLIGLLFLGIFFLGDYLHQKFSHIPIFMIFAEGLLLGFAIPPLVIYNFYGLDSD